MNKPMNRSDRRRIARETGKVISISPNVLKAAQRLAKVKRTSSSQSDVDRIVKQAVDEATINDTRPVTFTISNQGDRVVLQFERAITILALSPENTRRVVKAMTDAATLIESPEVSPTPAESESDQTPTI